MARTGRPSRLTDELRPGVTVADEIIERVRSGADRRDAAASVGVARSTLQLWLRDGARHAARRLSGDDLTDSEHELANFSDREAQALAEWKVEQELQLGILSSGRERIVETVKTNADGTVETTRRSETVEPNAQVILWRLERRFPEQYGRQRLEVSGPDGGPIPVSVRDAAVATLARMAEQLAENGTLGGDVDSESDGE